MYTKILNNYFYQMHVPDTYVINNLLLCLLPSVLQYSVVEKSEVLQKQN